MNEDDLAQPLARASSSGDMIEIVDSQEALS